MEQEETAQELKAAKLEVTNVREQLEGAWKMAEDETRRAQQLETEVGHLMWTWTASHAAVLGHLRHARSCSARRCCPKEWRGGPFR
jgi:hypothetical protein